MKNRMLTVVWLGTVIFTLNGCSGGLGGGFDAAGFAAAAFTQADTDSDGKISAEELEKVPSLLAALSMLDKDNDGAISNEELNTRMTSMQKVAKYSCHPIITVTQGQRPLVGATVTFVPATFIESFSQTATGVTDARGTCSLAIEGEENGLRCGFYRVEITHPSKKLSASVNTETKLGAQVALDLGRSSEQLFFNVPRK